MTSQSITSVACVLLIIIGPHVVGPSADARSSMTIYRTADTYRAWTPVRFRQSSPSMVFVRVSQET